MRVLFISRKKPNEFGGLSRFSLELTSRLPGESIVVNPLATPFSIFQVDHHAIDLIHLTDATLLPLGAILKHLLRKPLVLTVHGLDLAFPNPFYQLMLKILLPKVDAVVLDSKQAKQLLNRFSLDKIEVIHPGISVEHFKKEEPLRLPKTKGKIVLLTVGNLVPRKGHFWFIEKVFTHLSKDFIYLIVGDGSLKGKIEELIEQLKLKERVLLLGRVNDEQLGNLYKRVNIYVCPNQIVAGDFEGFGIAAGEAAVVGLPVVASNVDGIGEIIKHNKNGWLVEPTPEAFIVALLKLKEAKLRRKLGEKARPYTKTYFSWEKTIKKYVSLFQEVIDRN